MDSIMKPVETIERREVEEVGVYFQVVRWMHREAELLDALKEREWLDSMISPEIVYQVPVRQSVSRAFGSGFLKGAYHLDETYGSLAAKVARNETGFAWAEDPPSRVRHFISNVRVYEHETQGHLAVRSNMLIYRSRGEQITPSLFSGERHDVLVQEHGSLRLRERIVYLDATVIGSHNLAIFF
jgi:ethylbenzene dioxygenase beta subunit